MIQKRIVNIRSFPTVTTDIEKKLLSKLQLTTLAESEVLSERLDKYNKKNKLFGVWLPHDLYDWLITYLKVKSVGASTGERFRQWLFALQKQAGAVPIYKQKTTRARWICIRMFPREPTEQKQKTRCLTCQKNFKDEYKACQKSRREQQILIQ